MSRRVAMQCSESPLILRAALAQPCLISPQIVEQGMSWSSTRQKYYVNMFKHLLTTLCSRCRTKNETRSRAPMRRRGVPYHMCVERKG